MTDAPALIAAPAVPAQSGGIIDAHHHLWNPASREYPWMRELPALNRAFELPQLAEATAGTPVTATIVVQAASDAGETAWLLELAEASDQIVGVIGWLDLLDADIADRLAELAHSALVGIRHQVEDEPDPAWLARPEVRRGLRAIQDAGLACDLLVREPQRAAGLAAASAMPELSFVIDHLGKPDIAAGEWDGWLSWLAAMAARPNVTCKLSGLVTQASWDAWREQQPERYLTAALELFGPERCMFGSDWPVSLLAAEYSEVLDFAKAATATLSPAERHSVFNATAASVYGIKGGSQE